MGRWKGGGETGEMVGWERGKGRGEGDLDFIFPCLFRAFSHNGKNLDASKLSFHETTHPYGKNHVPKTAWIATD